MIVRCLLILLAATALLAAVSVLSGQGREPQGAVAEIRFKTDDDEPQDPPPQTSLRFAERADRTTSSVADATAEPAPRRRPDKHADIDPVKANGPIFVDWPKPDAVLLFSAEQDGYLEPCGCAGLNNQKGGLKRRHTMIKQLEAKGWPVVALDSGGQIKRYGKQAEIKFERTIESLMRIGYSAVGFGPQDLRMDLLALAINFDPPQQSPFVSANVAILDFDSGYTRRFKIFEVGGLKIGVTSVLGKKEIDKLQNLTDVQVEEPFQAIPKILPDLIAAQCDQLVLLAHTDREEAEVLARRFHEFDWVLAAGGPDEPPNLPQPIENEEGQQIAHLIEPGHRGMYVVAVGLYRNGPEKWRYQRVPLDHRFADSPEIQAIFTEYQRELETLGLQLLGVEPIDHPTGGQFAGSEVCADCHSKAYSVHEHTPHAHATQSLVELDPPRHHDPECLSCHVTGWNPQEYFPYTSGFLGLTETPNMTANGCENCHGPAKRHVEVEFGDVEVSDAEREKIIAALRLELVENEGNQEGQVFGNVVKMCMQCHDLDNSPDFDFQLYWPEVEHYGVD